MTIIVGHALLATDRGPVSVAMCSLVIVTMAPMQ